MRLLALLLGALAAAFACPGIAQEKPAARTGVVLTPKNFPHHGLDDLADMVDRAAAVGSFAIARLDWSDANLSQAARLLAGLAVQRNLAPVIALSPFKADDELRAARLAPPSSLAGGRPSFEDPYIAAAFAQTALELAELRPPYLSLAGNVNLVSAAERAAFARVYRDLYPRIKKISPDTKVFVAFHWEGPRERAMTEPFRGQLDLLAFSSEPHRRFARPGAIPAGYYAGMAAFGRAPLLLEVGWPSEGRSGEADQAAFIRDLPRLAAAAKPAMLAWNFLHDVKVLLFFTARFGLLAADGAEKPAFGAFRDLGNDRPPRVRPAAVASRAPAHFALYSARLDGSDLSILISSPDQEMTHPRVSFDGKRLVFTRYHQRGVDGRAKESSGYENTEIMLMNLDGSGLEVIVPPKRDVINANGDWAPDGKSLIWLTTDNAQGRPEIRHIDLATRKVRSLPTPPGLPTTDPHWHAGKVVFPVKAGPRGADALWIMNEDGSGARQITSPPRSSSAAGLYGDFDPRLSPKGDRVAFMRIDGGESWRVMLLDLASGQEKLLTPKGATQWLPTWSSDERLLLYVNFDRRRLHESGLYTMTPAGERRTMVPLPRGYLYGHSNFFPNDGSSAKARIVFNAQRMPGMP